MTRQQRERELQELLRSEGGQVKIVDLYKDTLGSSPGAPPQSREMLEPMIQVILDIEFPPPPPEPLPPSR
ncbi:MAG: hypothetical protein K8R36_25175 [Planctomycetales bacterium]|nr:hypothetical protein [Planctomycetales bacterium]